MSEAATEAAIYVQLEQGSGRGRASAHPFGKAAVAEQSIVAFGVMAIAAPVA